MRVTNTMMTSTLLRNLSSNVGRINKMQDQLGSGYRITRLSDDPLGMVVSLRARAKVYMMDQHNKNLDSADAWLASLEAGLSDINKITTTLYTDAIDASTDAKTAFDRTAIAQKVREFRDQLVQNVNSTINDTYIMGGYNGSAQPFEVKNGILYYNGYNMYANKAYDATLSDEENMALNAEAFIKTATDWLVDNAAGADENVTLVNANNALEELQALFNAASNAANKRQIEQSPGSNKYYTPTAQDVVDAMKWYAQAVAAGSGGTPSPFSQEIIAVAQLAVETTPSATQAMITVNDLMRNMEAMLSSVKGTVDGLSKGVADGSIGDAAEATQYLADAKKASQDQYDRTLEGMKGGLAKEAARKYEIEVGYGQHMNVTMNGIEIMGLGEHNLYKIVDDLYRALSKEYVDTELGQDKFVVDALRAIDDTFGATLTLTSPTTPQIFQQLIDAALGVDGGDMSRAVDAMNRVLDANDGDGGEWAWVNEETDPDMAPKWKIEYSVLPSNPKWTEDQLGAARTMIAHVQECVDAGMGRDEIFANLGAVSVAMGGIDLTDQAAVKTRLDAAEIAYRTSTNGFKTGSVATDITPFIPRLQDKQKDALANMSIVGGRVNRIEIVRARYELDYINYTERISAIEDADASEVITNLKMAEAVYNAALNGGARIIQPTLMDFMR